MTDVKPENGDDDDGVNNTLDDGGKVVNDGVDNVLTIDDDDDNAKMSTIWLVGHGVAENRDDNRELSGVEDSNTVSEMVSDNGFLDD